MLQIKSTWYTGHHLWGNLHVCSIQLCLYTAWPKQSHQRKGHAEIFHWTTFSSAYSSLPVVLFYMYFYHCCVKFSRTTEALSKALLEIRWKCPKSVSQGKRSAGFGCFLLEHLNQINGQNLTREVFHFNQVCWIKQTSTTCRIPPDCEAWSHESCTVSHLKVCSLQSVVYRLHASQRRAKHCISSKASEVTHPPNRHFV